jgi:hypothetical protein
MAEMTEADLIACVRSSAQLLDLALDAAQVERVALHLGRTRAIAAALQAVPLKPADELVEIFCPAPFPAEDAA